MSDYGFLVRSGQATPTTVHVELVEEELVLASGGETEAVPLRRLRKLSDNGLQLQLGLRGQRSWRLTVSGQTAEELRSRLRSLTGSIRWGAARTWHVLVFVGTLLVIELVKIPPEWLAPVMPAAMERRLVSEDLRTRYGSYCTSESGEQALRTLIARFDQNLARSLKIEVLTHAGFVISAVPGSRLVISNDFLTAIEQNELAALIAHEVAHLQRHDEVRAALRANGTLGSLIGTLSGTRRPEYALHFSPDEEWRADMRAIELLRRARIPTEAGAALFTRMDEERQANRSFGKEQYYLHYGMGDVRAERWRDAQDRVERTDARPALSQEQADAVFNYCWRNRGPPRNPLPKLTPDDFRKRP